MPRTPSRPRIAHRQAGAALVVGLLLLLVLTVLAISGMNTSSLNLIMAGNTQYSQNAFQAAEAGIERSIAANEFNPDPNLPAERLTHTVGGAAYNALSTVQLGGRAQLALPGASLDSFSTYHFEIESIGRSGREAVTRNVQAIAVIAPAEAAAAPLPPPPSGGGSVGTRLE